MKEKTQYPFYRLTLEDCCCPSFVSGTKYYHGQMSDIAALMEAIKADNERGVHNDTLDAFAAFQQGNSEATHKVAYSNERLFTPEDVIDCEDFSFGETEWGHTNIWDCVYTLKASAIDVSQVLVKQGQWYIRCIRPGFRDLMYRSSRFPDQEWKPVGNRFWGFPHTMVLDGENTYPRLFMEQQYYDDLEKALAELKDETKLNYSVVCEEIFGDG